MTLTKAYRQHADEFLDYPAPLFLDVFCKLAGAVEDEKSDNPSLSVDDAVFQAIDSHLIYNQDIWEVMAHYMTPQQANFAEAVELLSMDLEAFVREWLLLED